ncbi:MAG TPA: cytochrome c biogenesis protein ResB [Blastocatellia bacterium]|nr:cytochrome c biogenesis protein ResB [Blastocatellia bacterium]
MSPGSTATRGKKVDSIIDKVLALLSSVRLGIIILSILLVCCIIGMLVMQQNVDGFQQYYENLMPAQRSIYTTLGFFDIYYSPYFTFLLALLALNIILASIDRFPTAWQYVSRPKLTASPNFIRAQMFNRESQITKAPKETAAAIASVWRKLGLRVKVTEDKDRVTVFAQKNSWNRLGAYIVHVALLTILTGGFLTNKFGAGGMMEIEPGKTADSFVSQEIKLDGPKFSRNVLPFAVECNDLTQQLIRPEGNLEASNTVDWKSYITIKDRQKGVEMPLLVHLNNPQDYRGYRFFQNAFSGVGYARQITLSIQPTGGGAATEVTISRDGSATVNGLGTVAFIDFYPDFVISGSGAGTASGDYNKPVAALRVTAPDGTAQNALAYTATDLGQESDKVRQTLLVAGNRVILKSFEKVASSHTLQVQYDPGRRPVYIGFTLLSAALCSVFLFSHQRVWAVIEANGDSRSGVYFGGNTNRNRPAFEGRFNTLVESAISKGGGRGK